MKAILNRLYAHDTLNRSEAKDILVSISEGLYNEAQIASFLSVYLMRNISVDELSGFRDALLELCVSIKVDADSTIDLCGTGGDGKNTFNISTLSAFVVAGAGYKVTKHGNYGVSSLCGSSNVLEHLGYNFTSDPGNLNRQLERSNICFLHAPLFHPAMKAVAPVRKQLGVKTFFNMLGPLVNPAHPSHQLVGVFNLELSRLYQSIFQKTGQTYKIVYSLDGYDEISLTGPFKIRSKDGEFLLQPSDLQMDRLIPSDLFGGESIDDAASIFTTILDGAGTDAQVAVVCANAGHAIHCFLQEASILDCIALAKEAITSGNAMASFQKAVTVSNIK